MGTPRVVNSTLTAPVVSVTLIRQREEMRPKRFPIQLVFPGNGQVVDPAMRGNVPVLKLVFLKKLRK